MKGCVNVHADTYETIPLNRISKILMNQKKRIFLKTLAGAERRLKKTDLSNTLKESTLQQATFIIFNYLCRINTKKF